jgi:hypothetical protein
LAPQELGPPFGRFQASDRFLLATSPPTVVDGLGSTAITLKGERSPGLVEVERGSQRPYVGIYHNDGRIDVYSVRGEQMTLIGGGTSYVADTAGGVWIRITGSPCVAEHRADDARLLQRVSVGCKTSVREAAHGVLLLHDEASSSDVVLATASGVEALRAPRILGITTSRIVTVTAKTLQIYDHRGKQLSRLDVPNKEWGIFDDALRSPNEQWMLFQFGNPACPGPRQCTDLWLLNLNDQRWHHLAAMPTFVDLKASSVDWLPDGRLVYAGIFDHVGGAALVWSSNGTDVKRVKMPLPNDRGQSFMTLALAGS